MEVTKTFWDWVAAIVSKYGQMFISGAGTTMLIAITGTVIGFIIGLIVAIIKTVPVRPQDNKAKKIFLKIVNIILNIYIEIFRGTPMMVQAMIVYYGLMEAFKVSPIVLTTEDDWILEKELKLAYFVDLINRNEDIAAIRLATLNYAESRPSEYNLLSEVYSFNNIKNSVFNNQVALRHKRVYDKIGYYRENVNSDISEQDIIKKFNS